MLTIIASSRPERNSPPSPLERNSSTRQVGMPYIFFETLEAPTPVSATRSTSDMESEFSSINLPNAPKSDAAGSFARTIIGVMMLLS